MEITWHGHSCFRLTQRTMATVVTDPYDHEVVGYHQLQLRGDVVTVSHDAPGHNHVTAVRGRNHVLTGPGEFEIGDVFITGVRSRQRGKRAKEEEQPFNTLYVFDYEGVTVAHLGDLNYVPNQTEVEALGTVNVALVPVGGGGGLNAAKAAEVVSLLEPGYVIPMHFRTDDSKLKLDPLDKFLKEMGLPQAKPESSLKVSASNVPEETNVVVLQYER